MSGQRELTTDYTDCTDGVRLFVEEWNQRRLLPSVIFVRSVVKNFESARKFVKRFLLEKNISSFERLWDTVSEARQVSRKGAESVIMMPLSEWRSVQETLHLFRSPANGLRLLSALQGVEAQLIRTKGCRAAGGSRGR